ncbi:hypothetical protein JCM10207_002660 [Rhodosporidiobolus poonsookiae]
MSAQQQPDPASERFDKIRYDDLSPEAEWTRLGKGSFGSVFKAEYLGIEVAVKEVLPSKEYDVEKYLQREITLMQQARHPNIVQYLGLCLAPSAPGSTSSSPRILIISEYLPRGNLRQYILNRALPFPWRLRLSFATDIARALAYLHARQCMHRDLKGENCLVSENERLKACDFGLARVAGGPASDRLTYCGTDGYMSPEILLGQPFTLSTDIFSFGVLLLEIASRTLASNHTFARALPSYGISASEAWAAVSPACPRAFVHLALDCCATDPAARPAAKDILLRLRGIEQEVLEREAAGAVEILEPQDRGRSIKRQASMAANVGSIGYAGTTKRGSYGAVGAGAGRGAGGRGTARPSAPRLPSFEGQVKLEFGESFLTGSRSGTEATAQGAKDATPDVGHSPSSFFAAAAHRRDPNGSGASDDSDSEALLALAGASVPIDESDEDGGDSLTMDNLDLNLDMRPDSAYFDRVRVERGKGHRGYSGIHSAGMDDESDYSTSVVKPSSFLSRPSDGAPYGRLGSRSGSALPGVDGEGGSLPSLPPSWVAASRARSAQASEAEGEDEGTATLIAPSAGPSPFASPARAAGTVAGMDKESSPTPPLRASPAKPTHAPPPPPAATQEQEAEDGDAPSFLTARTSTVSAASAVVNVDLAPSHGHRVEPSASSTVRAVEDDEGGSTFYSTIQSVRARARVEEVPEADEQDVLDDDGADEEEEEVVDHPHRFSLIKPGFHRLFSSLSPSPASFSSYTAGLPSPASPPVEKRLSFHLLGRSESGAIDAGKDGQGRCGLCEKKFGVLKAFLCCDDCGLACHIKCSDLLPPSCPAYPSLLPASLSPSPASSPPLSPSFPSKPTRAPPAPPAVAAVSAVRADSRERDRPSKLVKRRPASVGGAAKRSASSEARPLSPTVA